MFLLAPAPQPCSLRRQPFVPPRRAAPRSLTHTPCPTHPPAQVDFCGKGGYVDLMGYDVSTLAAPVGPIK